MKRSITLGLAISFALLASLLMVLTVAANPPAPEDQVAGPVADVLASGSTRSSVKPIDQPNIKDFLRNRERQRLLEAGRTAEAEDLALTGTDRVLVILVEFAGTDTFTWNEGDHWDPLGISDPNEYTGVVGDCSNIITQTTTFTYTGPLHNEMPRPVSAEDRSGDSIWTEDFSNGWFDAFMFGDGVSFNYTREDGSVVSEDFTGQSVRDYFMDLSGGQYEIGGDVIGWVPVPHSTWYYDADQCPGARSGASTSRGVIPGAGNARDLVKDALDAVNAISNTIPGFDWANYDLDGDGVIDRLWIVHAGYGEEDSTDMLNRTDYGEAAVWSHSSAVYPVYPVAPGVAAGPYIVMPENGGIGVFAHEYAHNLGAWDLYAYGNGETSAGFWALQADDWTGYPIGFEPPAADPMHLDLWGWLDPVVIDDPTQEYVFTLGQASEFPGGAGVSRGAKIVLDDGVIELPVPVWSGDHYWWGGKLDTANAAMYSAAPIAIPAGATNATLSFDLVYDIEDEWDFLWIMASTNGVDWDILTNDTTQCVHDGGWIGGLYGLPDDLCGAGLGGIYGDNPEWPDPGVQEFDLTPYAGQQVFLGFWYMTDWGTTYSGTFIDNVQVAADGTVLFLDDAEAGSANWSYMDPWVLSDGTKSFKHNFYLQWRNVGEDGGYDSALGETRWRFGPANTGLLVWYNNTSYSDNEIFSYLTDFPGWGPKGNMLVVDAHPEPYRDPDLLEFGYNNEGGNLTSRGQMRDATFSLNDSVSFAHMDPYRTGAQWHNYPGRPAVSSFHDSLGYYPGAEYVVRGPAYPSTQFRWVTKAWDASAVVPAREFYGIKAPGYLGNQEFRFACTPYLSGPNTGYLGCYWYGAATGLGHDGGSGNPGDIGAQYGWHVDILEQTDSTAKIRVWNSLNETDQSFAADVDLAAPGDVVEYTYTLNENVGSTLNLFACVPLDTARVEYVKGSGKGGAVALPVACPAAAAAVAKDANALAQMASVAAGPVQAVGWTANVPTGGSGGFAFQVEVVAVSGVLAQDAMIYDEAELWRILSAEAVEIDSPEFLTPATGVFAAAQDTYVAASAPTSNYGDWAFLYFGATDILMSVAQFDVTSLDPGYPVDQAVLSVYVDAFSGAGTPGVLALYAVPGPWDEATLTWALGAAAIGGGPVVQVGGAPISQADAGQWIDIDITAAVQAWVANPALNNGVLFRLQNADSYSVYRLASSEYWFAQYAPKLTVDYRMP